MDGGFKTPPYKVNRKQLPYGMLRAAHVRPLQGNIIKSTVHRHFL